MQKDIKIKIDGKECVAAEGDFIVAAAKKNNIYIPTLCNLEGIKPKGSCRICTVKVNGRMMTACTTPVSEGMEIQNNTEELNSLRKGIIELLFVEGNHFCPSCEKSGLCELQALAYRYRIMVPRYPYSFPVREVDASSPLIIKEQNRCILCKRCIRSILDDKGKKIFAIKNRGAKAAVVLDPELGAKLTYDLAVKAMVNCPVGSIIVKERGFITPIGERKFDKQPIGNDIEKNINK